MKEQNNNFLYVITVFFMIISLGLGGFIFYDKVLNKEATKTNNGTQDNNVKVNDLSLDDTLVKELSSRVIGIYTNKGVSKYKDYFYKKDYIDISKEDISFKLSLASEMVSNKVIEERYSEDECNKGICGIAYLNEDYIKDIYHELFGRNSNYSRSSFNLSGCLSYNDFTWSDSNNRYETIRSDGCGDNTIDGAVSKLGYAKSVVNGNLEKVELYEYFALFDIEKGYYSDYQATNLIAPSNISKEELFEKYKNSVGIYKYSFIKDNDGTYVFTSVSKEK